MSVNEHLVGLHYVSFHSGFLLLTIARPKQTLAVRFLTSERNEHLQRFLEDTNIIKVGSRLERAAGLVAIQSVRWKTSFSSIAQLNYLN